MKSSTVRILDRENEPLFREYCNQYLIQIEPRNNDFYFLTGNRINECVSFLEKRNLVEVIEKK